MFWTIYKLDIILKNREALQISPENYGFETNKVRFLTSFCYVKAMQEKNE